MFGFFTITAFGLAWFLGGWWWLIAIVMSLAWIVKSEKEKEAAAVNQPDVIPETIDTQIGVNSTEDSHDQTQQLSNAHDWVAQVTDVCARYSGADYYVAELIPSKKLEKAMKSYPLPGGGRIVALIDSTIMGSADNGMAIGEHGISWHNSWTTSSKRTSFLWHELKSITIKKADSTGIEIGDGNKFDMSGCQFGKEQLVKLLMEIKALSTRAVTSETALSSRDSATTTQILIDVNIANYDQLISLPGIGAAEVKMILDRRKSQPFDSVESLADYLDLKPHKAEKLRDLLFFAARDRSFSPNKINSSLRKKTADKSPHAPPSTVTTSSSASAGRVID